MLLMLWPELEQKTKYFSTEMNIYIQYIKQKCDKQFKYQNNCSEGRLGNCNE